MTRSSRAFSTTGGDPDAIDHERSHDRALTIAVRNEDHKALALLLAHHADPNLSDQPVMGMSSHPPLYTAAWTGNVPAIRALVAAGAHIEGGDGDSETPLAMAAEGSHVDAIDVLIALHANLDGRGDNGYGYAPLGLAAEKGCIECVQHLVAAGAKLDRRDSLGMTALNYAAAGEHIEIVKLLLDAHADPYAANRAGWTPAFTASYHDKPELVELFRAHGVTDFTMHDPLDTSASGMGTISVPVIEVQGR